jgi:hypothetical protein
MNTTDSMAYSASWKPNSRSYSEITLPIMKLEGSLACSQEPAMISVLSHIIHSSPSYSVSLWSILTISHLCPGIPRNLFPLGFHTKILYTFLMSPIRANVASISIPLILIKRKIFCKNFQLWNSSLYSCLKPPVRSGLSFGANILVSTLFSVAFCSCFFP